ncbi:uncharacterized protein PV06_06482 [Exophiala oligosperma]|uniref:Uncharacterized protein n=1 Tax=Exophiala oligosperma TaxID=215243 RepID=A0A0D2DJ54_9EURO|nr:uncharacterized protein PV06_06482 [Exophiala oligosperma]KIW42993.1 hypothetical protein PV06_06482 [Exophiala oligosperma]
MDFLKIAGKLAGGKPGQDQTQGSGSSGLMHKITDAVTGQNHPGEKQNQRPYVSFPGNMSGPGAYQNMQHSGNPTGHYQPSGGYG